MSRNNSTVAKKTGLRTFDLTELRKDRLDAVLTNN